MPKIEVYQIDSAVPVPDKNVPITALEIGESFLFPIARRRSIQSLASRLKVKDGREFTVKKENDETARVWRIK